MSKIRRHVGRVVFGENEWIVLTLRSHVDNVTRLVEQWDGARAYLENVELDLQKTHKQTVTAARIHDMAKPSHFRLMYKSYQNNPPQWSYSFAGHRFAVEHEDLYIYYLGQLHHEYSVDGIVHAVATLRNHGYGEIAQHLPLDLYTLEMADQIEATVARAAVGDENPEARVFMDFVFETVDAEKAIYKIDPFPFSSSLVMLNIEYVTLIPDRQLVANVENADEDKRSVALRKVQEWLEKELQEVSCTTKEVTLCPWN